MNDKEYTYDIDKYTIGVDENGEDGIGMTVAKIENGEINLLGNCYGENARCLDLLIKENKRLKKQLEEINKMIEKCGFVNIEQLMLSYCGLIAQQKEFINYLEDEIHSCEAVSDLLFNSSKEMKVYKEILQKYREVIGASNEIVKYIKDLEQQVEKQKEVINNFLDIVDKSKMLLNNPDLLDLYLKIKEVLE